MSHQISDFGIELIKKHEGLRLHAYKDIAGILTIGYGHTGTDVTAGMVIDEVMAEDLLRKDVGWAVNAVNKSVKSRINQSMFDALVSFVFNLGSGAFANSTLLKKINSDPADPTIRDEFLRWNKARVGGVLQPVKGLTRRREQEANLYFSGGEINKKKVEDALAVLQQLMDSYFS